ncbi:unnamed protein product [Effrenium voratum]|nr:unnamed protein product [Effrenium voratum]
MQEARSLSKELWLRTEGAWLGPSGGGRRDRCSLRARECGGRQALRVSFTALRTRPGLGNLYDQFVSTQDADAESLKDTIGKVKEGNRGQQSQAPCYFCSSTGARRGRRPPRWPQLGAPGIAVEKSAAATVKREQRGEGRGKGRLGFAP